MLITALLVVIALVAALGAGLAIFTGWVAQKAKVAVPPIGRTIEVDGLRLHYLDEGAGPVVLMVHGLASQLQSFTYALTPLLRRRYRLLILDRPGNGYSQAAQSADLQAHAAIIAAFLRALQVERALVVGHSLGGAIALALALDHPDLVAGLALIAPASQPQDIVPEALRGLAIRSDVARRLIGWTLAVPFGIKHRAATLQALFSPDPVVPDFGTRGGALLPSRPWAFRHASRDLVGVGEALGAYAARYSTLRMPVGILFGTGDNILDYRVHGELLAKQVQGAELELIHAGHMIPLTQPAVTAAFIDKMAATAGVRA